MNKTVAQVAEKSPEIITVSETARTQSKGLKLDEGKRLVSLDAFRGLTMFLLVAEAARVYHALQNPALEGTIWGSIVTQFTHHPWNGLRFWDLIQPFFMFIVGVAMPFAFARRWERGETWGQSFRHVLYRSAVLLLLGVGLHCIYRGRLVWELWNVLAQLSVTYLIAFLLMRKSFTRQIGFTFILLAATELLYRLWPVPGFDQPFVKDHNFGSYMDLILMGKINAGGGWVAINFIPTTAHTMWGVLAGYVLMSDRSHARKIRILITAGLIGVVLGYALDPVTPIIKRICTSSFVIVSGGWCLLALALCYWLVDVKEKRKWATFALVVGMNSIFIYLFSNIAGSRMNELVGVFTFETFGWMGEFGTEVVTALLALAVFWYVCYWLYQRRAFIKI
ncbi:MAG: acyltransferase family protein [Acidobacteriota bacterium]